MYFIYFFNPETNSPQFESGHSAQVEAASPIEALKKWHQHINSQFRNLAQFTYHAEYIMPFDFSHSDR